MRKYTMPQTMTVEYFLGNLTSQTDARGCTLTLDYDELNRLITKVSTGSCGKAVNVTYTYDEDLNGIGRRTEAQNNIDNITTSWTYDTRGRVSSDTV